MSYNYNHLIKSQGVWLFYNNYKWNLRETNLRYQKNLAKILQMTQMISLLRVLEYCHLIDAQMNVNPVLKDTKKIMPMGKISHQIIAQVIHHQLEAQ